MTNEEEKAFETIIFDLNEHVQRYFKFKEMYDQSLKEGINPTKKYGKFTINFRDIAKNHMQTQTKEILRLSSLLKLFEGNENDK